MWKPPYNDRHLLNIHHVLIYLVCSILTYFNTSAYKPLNLIHNIHKSLNRPLGCFPGI